LALNGDNNYVGFLYIIENYGFTKAANLANYYAGVSYLHLGEWEKAIEYLKEFDSSDRMVWALSVANIGDAYVELGKYSDAITYYKKAANTNKNEFTTPVFMMKLAFAHNLAGEKDKALEVYKDVKEKYPKSAESVQAEKYIARLQ
jgi:tetratricopeptide (TPR) repeat protein